MATVTVTFSLDSAVLADLETAFGIQFGLVDANGNPRPATGQEIKQYIIRELKAIYQQHKQNQAVTALPPPPDPGIT